MSHMPFSSVALLGVTARWTAAPVYRVAFSGGLDSTVLLHALVEGRDGLPGELRAVHVNHGLHGDAGRWADYCRAACHRLGVPCEVVAVAAGGSPGESPEAAARQARYRAFQDSLGAGEALLTAHHRDDQAETVLLHLLRGSGPRGLAAMPGRRALGAGWLGRPLLGWSRAELRAWAQARGLAWLEDPSNRDERFDRNFLRRQVLPLLERRWPGVSRVLARDAELQAEAADLLDTLAAADLARSGGSDPGTLSVGSVRGLSPERARGVLRHWLRALGLPVPGAAQLGHLARDVLEARVDAVPCVRWPGAEVRRYRDTLVALRPRVSPDPGETWSWQPPAALGLPGGVLEAVPAVGRGVGARWLEERPARVRLRRGGERVRLPGRRHSQSLKKLLQAEGIPPWQRERLPLVYLADELAAVGDLWVCEPFTARPGEVGWLLRWTPQAGDT